MGSDQELDRHSACAIIMRNYGFSLQEVSDVGALLLFMHASCLQKVISDYRITAHDGFARVEARGECHGVWEGTEMLAALQSAVAGITKYVATAGGEQCS